MDLTEASDEEEDKAIVKAEDEAIMEYNNRQLVVVDKAPQLIFGKEFKVVTHHAAAPRGQQDHQAWQHGHCKGLTHEQDAITHKV